MTENHTLYRIAGRIAAWAGIVSLIYILRSILPALLLTFLFCYVASGSVRLLSKRFPYRRFNLVLTYLVALTVVAAVGSALVPSIVAETRDMLKNYIHRDLEDRESVFKGFEQTVRDVRVRVTTPRAVQRSPVAYHAPVPAVEETYVTKKVVEKKPVIVTSTTPDTVSVVDREVQKYFDRAAYAMLGSEEFQAFRSHSSYEDFLDSLKGAVASGIAAVIAPMRAAVEKIGVFSLQFVLAVIFSFIILWDLPVLAMRTRKIITGWNSSLLFHVSKHVSGFLATLGKGFEAQAIIAVVNTVLTTLGFLFLDLPSVAMLSSIVFVCSFIPVFGVIISTFPAALVAFYVGGMGTVMALLVLILFVHAVEAYVIDPIIFGRHLHLHPVTVLIILFIGEHLFGIWGLLLAGR